MSENANSALYLITAGADANAVSDDGWSALHAAIAVGNQEVCERLIEAGASLARKLPVKGKRLLPEECAKVYGRVKIAAWLADLAMSAREKTLLESAVGERNGAERPGGRLRM